MGLVDDIKNQVKKSGTNKGKFVYMKAGNKTRIRFLNDMEDGLKITFHDSYAKGVNTPCQTLFGRDCKYCDDDELRTRDQYVWSVWDHEAKEVKLFMFAVNSFTPIPALVAMYETYGTMLDRDYVITKTGTGQTTAYSVVPMDKSKFSNTKAKPYTQKKVLELIDKAYSEDDDDEDEGDREAEAMTAKKKKPRPADVADNNSYKEYEARELYQLCLDRGIEVEKKKPSRYYIELLEEDDAENEDKEPEYDDLSPKELYQLCVKRDINVEPKKSKAYYIKELEAADEGVDEDDDWGDEDEDEDEEDDW